MLLKVLSVLTLLLGINQPTESQEFHWYESLVKDGVTILVRDVPDSRYQEFRAIVDLEAKPAAAVALLQDNTACPKWVHRCASSEIIETVNSTERFFHQVTTLPFPAKARDAVFHGAIYFKHGDEATITLSSAHERLATGKHIRIIDTHGYYHIQPLGEGSIRLTWQFYVDPAGSLPAFLINTMVTDLPYRSLMAFRNLVAEAPYNQASFIYNASGVPIDITFAPRNHGDE